ncbi:hypothetical protein HOLleu_34987 [Holothuria leucospilota]|uniref:Uncharacterized protein n=1 Tax=Holothuria leucospilota TaxID=206669 RepID=A0A9Q0YNU7_HOLLE|nr:hypothetical protein HOLleu_34987 [Holothuria leucospilota]
MWTNRQTIFGTRSVFLCISFFQVLHGLRTSPFRSGEPSTTKSSSRGPANEQLERWATEAVEFARRLDCESVNFMTASECRRIQARQEGDMNIYVAPPNIQERKRYSLLVPDGGLRLSGEHDAVIVIDPYPKANFGHLVLIYYIDLGVERDRCTEQYRGFYLGHDECLQLAEKQRCLNRLRTRSNHRQCDINFIPLVHETNDELKHQKLLCRDDIGSFYPCPIYRTDPGNYTLHCELQANTRRCNEPRRQQVRARCKFYEICDQAVLISGGWNRHTNVQRHADNIKSVYTMLRSNGFRKSNIKTFFADSGDILDDIDRDSGKHTFPATDKYGIRNHISTLCRTRNCVDTFFIYMNSPALTDGTSLLWDRDSDGLATSDETYTSDELLEDLSECLAKHVYVVADQSFSGRLADALQSSEHINTRVTVFSSGSRHDYSWESELTNEWAHANHTDHCVASIYESYQDKLTSSPLMSEGMTGFANTTIFGAPCDRLEFYQRNDLRNAYMGCQNLPAWAWWTRHKRGGK